jgi:hypothetical protein
VPASTKPSSEQFLGDLISGTYCSRIFTDCDQRKCRLQSPNFPGLYPRNLTCYYAVSDSSRLPPLTKTCFSLSRLISRSSKSQHQEMRDHAYEQRILPFAFLNPRSDARSRDSSRSVEETPDVSSRSSSCSLGNRSRRWAAMHHRINLLVAAQTRDDVRST